MVAATGHFRMFDGPTAGVHSIQQRRAMRRAQQAHIPAPLPTAAEIQQKRLRERLEKELMTDLASDPRNVNDSLPPHHDESESWYRTLNETEEACMKVAKKCQEPGEKGDIWCYFEKPLKLRSGRLIFYTGVCHCECMQTSKAERDEIYDRWGWGYASDEDEE